MMAVLAFLKSKAAALLALAVAVGGVVLAIFARGRQMGQLEQKVEQEKKEDAAEAQLAAGELAEARAERERQDKLTEDLEAIARETKARRAKLPTTLADAQAEQQAARKRLSGNGAVKK